MPSTNQLNILMQGSKAWNAWREQNPTARLDLNIEEAVLAWNNPQAQLEMSKRLTVLAGKDLSKVNLQGAGLFRADLRKTQFWEADLRNTNLSETDLRGANLGAANLTMANLERADLRGANLCVANLSGAYLDAADLSNAAIGWTLFSDNDLSSVKGLESVQHAGPSTVGLDTLYLSQGKIPAAFLQGVGLPNELIIHVPSFIQSVHPIQFHSCFISYSHHDEEFAKKLHSRMRLENLRVWYAPEDMKAGKKLHEEIFRAIQIHDKLLLVLSDSSMTSEWVKTEIRRAIRIEREEDRRKLFPIRLIDFDAIKKWECFDSDSNKDLAVELREYHILDFSNWEDQELFEREFAKLLRDLKATEK